MVKLYELEDMKTLLEGSDFLLPEVCEFAGVGG